MFQKAVSITGFVIMVAAILLLIQSRSLFGDTALSIGLQIGAVLLMVWARVTLGKRSFHVTGDPTDGTLVTSGPYRYLRHPIYAAGLCFIWAGVISHFAVENALIAFGSMIGVGMRVYVEEQFLCERYPEYLAYSYRTRRFIPFLL